jgi:hypothetical protein
MAQKTETFYTSLDGYIRSTGQSTWSAARSTSAVAGSSDTWYMVGTRLLSGSYYVYRGYLKFDTTAIPENAEILKANVKLTLYSDSSATDFNLRIYNYDWSIYDPFTSYREQAYDGLLATGSAYVTWRGTSGISINTTYTSPDIATSHVNKGGYTYFGLISDQDRNNTAPTNDRFVGVYYRHIADAWKRPQLEVTYKLSSGVWVTIF